jgi:predicted nucleic acid-binding protein
MLPREKAQQCEPEIKHRTAPPAGAPKVNELLKDAIHGRARVLMSAVNYGEVYARILHDYTEHALTSMHAINPLPIEILDVTPQRALGAADVKVNYKLYYVDSFAAALAIEHKARLVTSDSDFRKLGHNLSVIWLKV